MDSAHTLGRQENILHDDRPGGVDYYVDAYEWNDAPGRTLDEVFAVYDKAIAIAEKEESEC